MSQTILVSSGEVPENLECVISNERWQELVALLSIILPDGFSFNIGSTTPDPADRTWPWLRLDSNGRPDRIYYYASGFWLAKYHTPASSPERRIWTGSTADLLTYDEGENQPVSEIAGPFWEVDTTWEGKSPMGVGTLAAIGSDPPVAVAANTNYGSNQYTILNANIQRHRHWVLARQSISGGSLPTGEQQVADDGGGNAQENYLMQGTGTVATRGRTSFVHDASQNDNNTPFSILNPVRGCYFIKRTARNFWKQNAA